MLILPPYLLFILECFASLFIVTVTD